MARVSSISRAPTPASSWVVICALTPRSTAAPYDQPAWNGDLGQGNRYRDYFASRSRLAFNDRYPHRHRVRRRSHLRSVRLVTFDLVRAARSGTLGYRQPLARNGSDRVEMVFIQFAGFTFGKSASAYATPWHGYPGNNSSFLLGGHDTVIGTNNIQYTAQFGNGVSGTIGLDDPLAFNRTAVYNLATPRLPASLRSRSSAARCATPTLARMLRTSSAISASTRHGVCSRFRAPCMKLTVRTTL